MISRLGVQNLTKLFLILEFLHLISWIKWIVYNSKSKNSNELEYSVYFSLWGCDATDRGPGTRRGPDHRSGNQESHGPEKYRGPRELHETSSGTCTSPCVRSSRGRGL